MVIRLIYQAQYFDSMSDATFPSIVETALEKRKRQSWEAFIGAMRDDMGKHIDEPRPHTKTNSRCALAFTQA